MSQLLLWLGPGRGLSIRSPSWIRSLWIGFFLRILCTRFWGRQHQSRGSKRRPSNLHSFEIRSALGGWPNDCLQGELDHPPGASGWSRDPTVVGGALVPGFWLPYDRLDTCRFLRQPKIEDFSEEDLLILLAASSIEERMVSRRAGTTVSTTPFRHHSSASRSILSAVETLTNGYAY